MRLFWAILLTGTVFLASACKSQKDENAAIREGVLKHLSGMNGLSVNNMTVTLTKATLNGDKAQADVDIHAKGSDPNAPGMQLTYELQKQGNEWVVLRGQATGGMQHPAPGQTPPQGAMPPGHPAVSGADGQMPADHPDFNSILNSAQPQPPASSSQQPSHPQPSSNGKP